MPRIIINNSEPITEDTLKLNNGSLVIINDNKPYLVTSYRGDLEKYAKNRSAYCTLIDLQTGYPAFEEPSSRTTSSSRIQNHFYSSYDYRNSDKKITSIKVIDSDSYSIQINYKG